MGGSGKLGGQGGSAGGAGGHGGSGGDNGEHTCGCTSSQAALVHLQRYLTMKPESTLRLRTAERQFPAL